MNKKDCRKLWRAIWSLLIVQLVLMGCGSASINRNLRQPENMTAQISEFTQMSGVPTLLIETISNEYRSEDGMMEMQIAYDVISLSGNGFEDVAQAISKWNEQDIGKLALLKEKHGDYAGWPISYTSNVTCTRMDNRVISLKQQWYENDGEPWEKYFGVNFDTISGKRLTLADILTDEEGFLKKAVMVIVKKLQETLNVDDFKQEYELIIENDLMSDDMWYLDAYGITFCCRPYGHGAYAEYELVTVAYEELSEYMKPEYCGIQSAGIAYIPANETIRVKLSKEADTGKSAKSVMKRLSDAKLPECDKVMVTHSESINDGENTIDVSIMVNDRWEDLETCYWADDAYLLYQEDGKVYLVLEMAFDYNYNTVYFYDISAEEITMVEEYLAWFDRRYMSHNTVLLHEPVDVLGTHFVSALYTIREESGKLVRAEVRYTNEYTDDYALHVIRELPVVINGEETYLQPGSQILITALDDSGIVYFREINTKLEGEIHYTNGNGDESGGVYIDGVEEVCYFEYLPYSG